MFADARMDGSTGITAGPDGAMWFTTEWDPAVGRIIALSVPFSDVGLDHTFVVAIDWLASEGISTGYEDGTFRPTVAVSRQAMASFLWKYAGSPEPESSDPFFSDVGPGHQFFDAIQWLAEEGISTGTPVPGDKPVFKTTDPVSRQAMAAFLWRFGGEQDPDLSEAFFADVTGGPFFDAVQWMGATGLSTGTANPGGKPSFKPVDAVSRQAMAAFLHRFDRL